MNTDTHRCEEAVVGVGMNDLSEKIIGCAFTVSNLLGCGFLEKVYENALVYELKKSGLMVMQQVPVPVWYDSVQVGDYVADLIVADTVLVELKAVQALDPVHEAQCHNYLKATGKRLCLLLNFGRPKIQIKRIMK